MFNTCLDSMPYAKILPISFPLQVFFKLSQLVLFSICSGCCSVPLRIPSGLTEILVPLVARSKTTCPPKVTLEWMELPWPFPEGSPWMSAFLEKTQSTTWQQFDFIGTLQLSKRWQSFLTKTKTHSKYGLSFLPSRSWPVPFYKNFNSI